MEAAGKPPPPLPPLLQPPSPPPLTAVPLRCRRRGGQADISIRVPGQIDILFNDFQESPTSISSLDRSEDDDNLLASYMDMEKLQGGQVSGPDCSMANEEEDNNRFDFGDSVNDNNDNDNNDNDKKCSIKNDDKQNRDAAGEAKKAMSPHKLAELWNVDPKRAKRILANRQSAARSKERKAQYIVELEKKLHSLQREATALSVQLSLYERDTTGFTCENMELRRQLESMEQQAQLRDALNDALKQELDRLKVATGEYTSPAFTFFVPVQNTPYSSRSPHPGMDSPKSKDLLCSVDTNMSNMSNMSYTSQALESPNTQMSNLCLKSNSSSPHHQPEDMSNVKSQQQYQFETNGSNLPPSPKIQQFYPPETSLYIPADSAKPTMSQSYSTERNMHCLSQAVDSPHGHLPHYTLQSNTSNPPQHVTSESHMLAAQTTSQDHFSQMQGFDIGGIASNLMKLEGQSIFVSESMGGF